MFFIKKYQNISALFICVLYLLVAIFFSSNVTAVDVVKINVGDSALTINASYKREILHAAMSVTINTYGPYKLISKDRNNASSKRAVIDLETGKNINVYFAVTNEKWEKSTIPIKIPIRKGITSYRLLLVHKNSLDSFLNITTLDQLKTKTVGLEQSMTTYGYMKSLDFNVFDVADYDSMFKMLEAQRFDFTPRTVNEIYEEMDVKSHLFNELVILPGLALYMPSTTYLFVSKSEPRLAERLSKGLEIIIKTGKLDEIFNSHFGESIAKANLINRRIINVGDIIEFNKNKMVRPELWLTDKQLHFDSKGL